jgi:NAD(P)-dependent dehydrogenase (short-subunit alcohol dehydrogenase family)
MDCKRCAILIGTGKVNMLLKDKVCVVVGAGSLRSIGFAVVEIFIEHGAKVVAVDLTMDPAMLAEMQAVIESRLHRRVTLHGVACDVTRREDCRKMVASVMVMHGRIDALVNSAAIVKSQSILDIDEEDMDAMLNVNLKGSFNVSQAVLRVMLEQKSGAIVNLASVAAQRGGGLVGGAHYAASKGGVISLTRTIARECGPHGIRANVICPSMTDTGMLDGTVSEEMYQSVVAQVPLRRIAKPQEMANVCLFLASDLSSYVTGATIDVNGGTHIH